MTEEKCLRERKNYHIDCVFMQPGSCHPNGHDLYSIFVSPVNLFSLDLPIEITLCLIGLEELSIELFSLMSLQRQVHRIDNPPKDKPRCDVSSHQTKQMRRSCNLQAQLQTPGFIHLTHYSMIGF